MTWISSFVNGEPCWMLPNQANWKTRIGVMTESTVGSSYVSFHSSTLKATLSGGLEAILTSKIEKGRRRNSLRRSGSFAGLPMLYANHCRPGPEGQPLYANQAMLDYTGLTMQDVIASDFRARTYHPEDLERVREERKAGLARGLRLKSSNERSEGRSVSLAPPPLQPVPRRTGTSGALVM